MQRRDAVRDPALAGGPALDQRRRADAQRRHGADAGDHDTAGRVVRAEVIRPRHHQIDHVADRLHVLDRVAVELDAELVLDDLRELDQVERVDVEALEGRLAGDLALGADLLEAVEDHLLDRLVRHLRCHLVLLSSFLGLSFMR